MSKVRTCLWFESGAEEAARFYTGLLPESGMTGQFGQTADGAPLIVQFQLCGTPYEGLNGGPMFPQTEAASISVTTEDQAETDRLWEALTADGGSESMCGWLKDRWGVSWQIVPRALADLLGNDPTGKVTERFRSMRRIVIADLQAARDG